MLTVLLVVLCALQFVTVVGGIVWFLYSRSRSSIQDVLFHMYGYTTMVIREAVIVSLKTKGTCSPEFKEWRRKHDEMNQTMLYIESHYDKLVKSHMIYPLMHQRVLGSCQDRIKDVWQWRETQQNGIGVSDTIDKMFKEGIES
jgi:hypothetical protein